MAITKEVLDELLKEYKGPEDFHGPDGLIKQLSKALIERAMQAELTEQIDYEKSGAWEKPTGNRRNGKHVKTLRTDQGPMEIEVPRDRDGDFEPQIVAKHRREWRGFDDKILSMYGVGLSTEGIREHIKDIYNVEISAELVSRVTDEVKGLVDDWRSRPLEPMYPAVFFDALRVNIRDEGHVVKKAVYIALAIRPDGQKEALGMWVERNEGSKFRLGILNELKNRGVGDILIAAVDGLTGFPEAINAVFPKYRGSAVHRAHGPQLGEVRAVQGPQGRCGGPQGNLPGPRRRTRPRPPSVGSPGNGTGNTPRSRNRGRPPERGRAVHEVPA